MKPAELCIEDKIAALSRSAVFSRLETDAARLLAEAMKTERLAAGEVLFEAGDVSDRVYLVVEGALRVTVGPHRTRALRAGDVLGEYALFAGLIRTATVAAEAPATLLSLDYTRFRSFLTTVPGAALILLQIAIERMLELEARLSASDQAAPRRTEP